MNTAEKMNLWITSIILIFAISFVLVEEDNTQKILNDHIAMSYEQTEAIDMNIVLMQESIAKLVPVAEDVKLYNLGEFRITYYCNDCDKCGTNNVTSDGTKLNSKMKSVAVDTSIIPNGSRLLIDGVEYIANDTGGEIDGNRIDIMVYGKTHEEVSDMGVDELEVYLIIER